MRGALPIVAIALVAGCRREPTLPTTFAVGPKQQLMIQARINHRPVVLQLDTGSSTTSLSERGRRVLGYLARGRRATGGGAGGTFPEVEYYTLFTVQLASETLHYVAAAALDLDIGGAKIDGLLGMDVLGRYVFDIDLRTRHFALHREGARLHLDDLVAVDYAALPGGQVSLPITIDGRAALGILDLGANRTLANRRVALAPDDPEMTITAVISVDRHPITFHAASEVPLRIGALALRAPSIWISDLPIFHTFGIGHRPAVVLGLDVLAGRRIVIDPFARRVYLSR